LTVGVVDGPAGSRALPPSEVRLEQGRAFDYEGKYLGKGTKEITPAEGPPAVSRAAQDLGLAAHRALGCEGYSRTDAISSPQGPRGDGGVALGGGERSVPEQLLDAAEIGPHVQQVCREAVPERVRMDVPAGAGDQRVPRQVPGHAAGAQAPSVAIHQQREPLRSQLGTAAEVRPERGPRFAPERHDPFLVPLSADADRLVRHVAEVEPHQLGYAQPGAIEQLQRRPI